MVGNMSLKLRIGDRLRFTAYRAYAQIFSSKSVRHNGATFTLGTRTANEVHRAITFSRKEPETLAWIDTFPNNVVFYDIGANTGIYSLYAAKRHVNAKIYAFEPEAQSFAALSKNIFRNRFGRTINILPFQFALARETHIGTLNISIMQAGAGAAALDADYSFVHAKPSDIFKQGIAAFSLDDLVNKHGFPQPDFVKIDVDGLEGEILDGARKVLSSTKLKGLLVEFQYQQESDLAGAFDRLADLGLYLHTKSSWVSGFEGTHSRNFIFHRTTV